MSSRVVASVGGILRPTIVLDLDETVLFRPNGLIDTLRLYLSPGTVVGEGYPDAVAVLTRLQPRFNLAAVTARWSLASRNTDEWLLAHGLNGIPALHASRPLPLDDSRIGFKSAAIDKLREMGLRPVSSYNRNNQYASVCTHSSIPHPRLQVMGVGDRPSDLEAYHSKGLTALGVRHCQRVHASRSICAPCMRALGALQARADQVSRRGSSSAAIHLFTDCLTTHSLCTGHGPLGQLDSRVTSNFCKLLFRPHLAAGGSLSIPSVWLQLEEFMSVEGK